MQRTHHFSKLRQNNSLKTTNWERNERKILCLPSSMRQTSAAPPGEWRSAHARRSPHCGFGCYGDGPHPPLWWGGVGSGFDRQPPGRHKTSWTQSSALDGISKEISLVMKDSHFMWRTQFIRINTVEQVFASMIGNRKFLARQTIDKICIFGAESFARSTVNKAKQKMALRTCDEERQ